MFKPITSRINKLVRLFDGEKINSELLTSILMYLIITPVDAILYMQWINTMSEYTWMAGAVIYPLFGLFFFAIPTMIMQNKKYILDRMKSSAYIPAIIPDKFNMYIDEITQEQMDYPKFQLAQIGSMDSMGSILGALSTPFISIMLNVIISKLTLPMTMFASYFFLNKKYKKYHYLGVTTTMFGILVAAIPKLYLHNTNTEPAWLLLFICSLIPGVISYIIKEIYLTQYKNADSWYMNTIISIYQVCIGICSLLLLKLPIPTLYVSDMGKYIGDSLQCQFYSCKYSLLYLLMFQVFGTIANILMFKIIRKGSSVTFIMINTIKTPITALMGFFLIFFRVITYTQEQKFVITWLDIISLILIIIGAIQYTSAKEKTNDETVKDDKYKLLEAIEQDDDSDDEKQILLNEIVEC